MQIHTLDVTRLTEREGWDCAKCGHRHAGWTLANICVGCPCPETAPMDTAEGDPMDAATAIALLGKMVRFKGAEDRTVTYQVLSVSAVGLIMISGFGILGSFAPGLFEVVEP